MKAICQLSGKEFEISKVELEFYQSQGLDLPKLCPEERQRRRLNWRNLSHLYKRKCDFSGEDIISLIPPESELKVYKNEYWYSDSWDGLDYGSDYDLNESFFDQFKDLLHLVPQLARSTVANTNSDYTNQAGWCKNCYLTFEADNDQDCMYSIFLYDSKNCFDCSYVYKSELCYECIDCRDCYHLMYSQNCINSSDSYFLKNCIGCKNCFGSINLKNKEYYFFNQALSKAEYKEKLKELNLDSHQVIKEVKQKCEEHFKKFPNKNLQGLQNENSLGDYLWNTQNCQFSFDLSHCQNVKYSYNLRNTKNSYDLTGFGADKGIEFCVDCQEIGNGIKNVYYSDQIWNGCYNIWHSKLCIQNSHDLLGCVGLKHKSYCILNKQYNQTDYQALFEKIKEQMKKNGEWGEFFPSSMSPFAYNESMAQYYMPLSEIECKNKGYKWTAERDDQITATKSIPANMLPDSSKDTPDDILNWSIETDNQKAYKITKQELAFYRQESLSIPRDHWQDRFKLRLEKRNPSQLFDRKCDKCSAEIQSSFSPDREEIVYCEQCYLDSLG